MHRHSIWSHLRWIVIIGWAGGVLMLTIMPGNTPLMARLIPLFSGELSGALGHSGLLGSLTLIGYLCLCEVLPGRRGLLLVMAAALLLGTGTELAQATVAGRASTVSDLLGNWLGVITAGFLISLFAMRWPKTPKVQ